MQKPKWIFNFDIFFKKSTLYSIWHKNGIDPGQIILTKTNIFHNWKKNGRNFSQITQKMLQEISIADKKLEAIKLQKFA
jgi:hypothetical protein